MAESGCLSCIKVEPGNVFLTDRLTDHGEMFQITKATGEKLCKRFTGLGDFERDVALSKAHNEKLPAVYRLRKNEELALLLRDGI